MGNVHVHGNLVGHFLIGGLGGAPCVEELGRRQLGTGIGGLEGHEGAVVRFLGCGFGSFFDNGGNRGEDGFVVDNDATFVLLCGGLFVAPTNPISTPATGGGRDGRWGLGLCRGWRGVRLWWRDNGVAHYGACCEGG